MLKLNKIVKIYPTGDSQVAALREVSLNFRKNEFVSILGPSGCGKTTLLNIIGGLDRYTSGDLFINGRSTKKFKDSDWDSYRNHSIGFVFQNYNLIPHQTVLANVELALTLSGVSKAERRKRAIDALAKVGLGDQIKKKPNQMSGGQMQRVAIARALVNDPEILLADEPTGALDTQTSVQIMNILKEISRDKLIIMVTHNPELAEEYSSRIIRLLDGQVVSDSNPYDCGQSSSAVPERLLSLPKKTKKKKKKTSMSFFTALSLSFQNLLTKKTRTFLTSFAGSIGIIGIALILALSNGVQLFINSVQEDTLSSYPISLQAEEIDITSLMLAMMESSSGSGEDSHPLDAVYTNRILYDLLNVMNQTEVNTNNLTAFRKFLEKEMDPATSTTDLYKYVSSIQYSYDMSLNIYGKDEDGNIIHSDTQAMLQKLFGTSMGGMAGSSGSQSSGMMSSSMSMQFTGLNVWQEMLPGENGSLVNSMLTDEKEGQYDLLAGKWPEKSNELVLIVDKNNELSDLVLYTLGLKTTEEMREQLQQSQNGEIIDTSALESWSYDDILKMSFKLILPSDCFVKNSDGTYKNIADSTAGIEYLFNEGMELNIVGIIRQSDDASSGMLTGAIGYTSALTDEVIAATLKSDIVKQQLANPTVDVISGLPFLTDENGLSEEEMIAEIKQYLSTLTDTQKAAIYISIISTPSDEMVETTVQQALAGMTRKDIEEQMLEIYSAQMGIDDIETIKQYIAKMDDETLFGYVREEIEKQFRAQYAEKVAQQLSVLPHSQLAMMLDNTPLTNEQYLDLYDEYMPKKFSDYTYEEVIKALGYVDANSPTTISIYTSTFDDKDMVKNIIADYNKTVDQADQIFYTDIVAIMMSYVSTTLNAISYVLIAFVSVSLVVSSIMIGIITYISVLERTKEIGILRSIGASKRDISRVFNAETAIIGFCSGLIGIGSTVLLCIPINAIVRYFTGLASIRASLPLTAAIVLIAISMMLTLFAGLIPSKIASKKDPVVALRSE